MEATGSARTNLPFHIDLSARVVVVTGGGGILCSVFAEALSQCGAKVAVLDLHSSAAERVVARLREQGGTALAVTADVLDRGSLADAAAEVARQLGPCDILINGAGGNHPSGTTTRSFLSASDLDDGSLRNFFDLETSGIELVMNLNFLGTLLPTQIFARQMVGRAGCSVINISSMSALSPLTQIPAYSAAKAAVSNLTQWLAVHFSKVGIRVNAIAPGFFLTQQNQALLIDKASGMLTERARRILDHTPMGRFGDPHELIGVLLWLCSKEASGFVSGIVVPVDGGFSAYPGV